MLDVYECRCTPGFSGKHCDKVILRHHKSLRNHVKHGKHRYAAVEESDKPVKFDGNTYIRYPNKVTKNQPSQHGNGFIFRFRTKSVAGLILLQHKSSTVDGDYIAIALVDGTIQVSYNLGKQSPSNLHMISSVARVADGEWHTVSFTRDKRQGNLSVDGEEPVSSVSVTGATQLDTDGSLWIGGSETPPRGLPQSYMNGFIGCIESVQIDGEQLDLMHHRLNADKLLYCS
jgi:agrin